MEKRIEYQGMTSQPSDYVCPDGDMKLAVNAEYRDGGWKEVKEVKEPAFSNKKILYIHSVNGEDNDIILYESESKLRASWANTQNSDENKKEVVISSEITIETDFSGMFAIGNVLSFVNGGEIRYLIYKEAKNKYVYLEGLPDFINFEFRAVRQNMSNTKWVTGQKGKDDSSFTIFNGWNACGCNSVNIFNQVTNREKLVIPSTNVYSKIYTEILSKYTDGVDFAKYTDENNDYDTLINFVFGGLANIKNYLENVNLFMYPVLLKYAFKLYDGSYINESPPILIFPDFNSPSVKLSYSNVDAGKWNNFTLKISDIVANFEAYEIEFRYDTCLEDDGTMRLNTMSKYSEIIKSVDFFLSPPLYSVDLNYMDFVLDSNNGHSCFFPKLKRKDLSEEINKVSNFYFVSSVDFKSLYLDKNSEGISITKWRNIFQDKNFKLKNYTDGNTIQQSSYFNGRQHANGVTVYNNRLLLFDLKKNHLNGLDLSIEAPITCDCQNGNNGDSNWLSENSYAKEINKMYLNIQVDSNTGFKRFDAYSLFNCNIEGSVIIAGSSSELCIKEESGIIKIPYFLSITENTADYIFIRHKNESCGYSYKLKSHPLLNISYNLGSTNSSPDGYLNEQIKSGYLNLYTEGEKSEKNVVYLSIISNPFCFDIRNYAEVGSGRIISIATNSLATSQGQFGQYPLYAFCTDGVYSIGIGTDGTLQNCVPLSYDILTDKHSVGKMEQIVVFATREGIIALSGSERKVLLSADKEADYTFDNDKQKDFITNTVNKVVGITPPQMTDLYTYITTGVRFAFDANHGRLIAFNPAYDYSYIMDAKTNNWSVFYKGFDSVLNIPEQCLLVRKETNDDGKTEYNVYDYSSDEVVDIQKSYFITRPFKLDMPDVHKSIQSIIQRGVFCDRKDVQQALYGSNDLHNWTPVWSSKDIYLRGMRGSGYKYYRMAIFIPKFKQDEILHGCSVEFTPRLTNKPR